MHVLSMVALVVIQYLVNVNVKLDMPVRHVGPVPLVIRNVGKVVAQTVAILVSMVTVDVINLILGYPSLINKIFEIFLGKIHRENHGILGYPRIPGSPLTTSLCICSMYYEHPS